MEVMEVDSMQMNTGRRMRTIDGMENNLMEEVETIQGEVDFANIQK